MFCSAQPHINAVEYKVQNFLLMCSEVKVEGGLSEVKYSVGMVTQIILIQFRLNYCITDAFVSKQHFSGAAG